MVGVDEEAEHGVGWHHELVLARLSLDATIYKSVSLGPFEDAVLSLDRSALSFVLFLIVEVLWHVIFETLAADVWLFKDPRASLTIRISKERIRALCTPSEAIVDEASVASADCGLTSLLALSMATAVLVSTVINTLAYWFAFSRDWIHVMSSSALAAVFAFVGRLAAADTGVLVAAGGPFPVTEALRCAYLQLTCKELSIEVCTLSKWREATEVEPVAPASRQTACRELEDYYTGIGGGELLRIWLHDVRRKSGRARLFCFLRDKGGPIS